MRPGRMRPLLIIAASALAAVGCDATDPDPSITLRIVVVAGPTCPVVSDPPDPSCGDRPVEGAVVVVRAASATIAAGTFTLEPQPVDGLLGTPPPMQVTVAEGTDPDPIIIAYDTGIR